MLMTGRALAFAVTFFVPAVLARVFTQAEFGTYKQFMLITYTLYGFGQFGFSECLFYFLPLNPAQGARYAFNSLVMLGVLGSVLSFGLFLNAASIASWMNNRALSDFAPLAALYLVFMLMGAVLEITMIGRKNYRMATAAYVVSDVLRAVFLIVPALVTGSLYWALAGGVTYCFLRVVAVLSFFRMEFNSSGLRFDSGVLREQMAYALPFFCAAAVQIIQQNYHQYAVSWHYDAAAFAIYSIGCLQIPLVDFMATPASNVMMVQMGEDLRDGRRDQLLPVWHDTTRKLAFVFFPMVGLLIVSAYHLITLLFTTAYEASVPIFMVWSLSILFAALQTDGVLRTFAENRWLLTLNITRLVMIVALMSWFMSVFGLTGAVLITILGIAIAKSMALIRMKSLLQATLAELLPWKSLAGILMASAFSAVPAIIVNATLKVPSIGLLPAAGMAYMVTYTAIVLGFGLLDEAEIAAIKRYVYVWNRRSAESR